jgi:hypothetical protein
MFRMSSRSRSWEVITHHCHRLHNLPLPFYFFCPEHPHSLLSLLAPPPSPLQIRRRSLPTARGMAATLGAPSSLWRTTATEGAALPPPHGTRQRRTVRCTAPPPHSAQRRRTVRRPFLPKVVTDGAPPLLRALSSPSPLLYFY